MRILVTGFEPFGSQATNSSQVALDSLRRYDDPADVITVTCELLPTAYALAEERLRTLIPEVSPDVCLLLGMFDGTDAVRLERVAVNFDDEAAPDNCGEVRRGHPISPDGPPTLMSSLPIDRIQRLLTAQGIPAVISESAGYYVCNHVFYVARLVIETLDQPIPCGFIHLPSLWNGDNRRAGRISWPRFTVERAAEICVTACAGIGVD